MAAHRISIDRLAIELSGISAEDARRLAELVATGLADSTEEMEPRRVPELRVQLSARQNQTLPALAHRIVAATLGALRRAA